MILQLPGELEDSADHLIAAPHPNCRPPRPQPCTWNSASSNFLLAASKTTNRSRNNKLQLDDSWPDEEQDVPTRWHLHPRATSLFGDVMVHTIG